MATYSDISQVPGIMLEEVQGSLDENTKQVLELLDLFSENELQNCAYDLTNFIVLAHGDSDGRLSQVDPAGLYDSMLFAGWVTPKNIKPCFVMGTLDSFWLCEDEGGDFVVGITNNYESMPFHFNLRSPAAVYKDKFDTFRLRETRSFENGLKILDLMEAEQFEEDSDDMPDMDQVMNELLQDMGVNGVNVAEDQITLKKALEQFENLDGVKENFYGHPVYAKLRSICGQEKEKKQSKKRKLDSAPEVEMVINCRRQKAPPSTRHATVKSVCIELAEEFACLEFPKRDRAPTKEDKHLKQINKHNISGEVRLFNAASNAKWKTCVEAGTYFTVKGQKHNIYRAIRTARNNKHLVHSILFKIAAGGTLFPDNDCPENWLVVWDKCCKVHVNDIQQIVKKDFVLDIPTDKEAWKEEGRDLSEKRKKILREKLEDVDRYYVIRCFTSYSTEGVRLYIDRPMMEKCVSEKLSVCPCCPNIFSNKNGAIMYKLEQRGVLVEGQRIMVGDYVYVHPLGIPEKYRSSMGPDFKPTEVQKIIDQKYSDHSRYPEAWRFNPNYQEANLLTQTPLMIGQLKDLKESKLDLKKCIVQLFYRPWDLNIQKEHIRNKSDRELFWTEFYIEVDVEFLQSSCNVSFEVDDETRSKIEITPNSFFCNKVFDPVSKNCGRKVKLSDFEDMIRRNELAKEANASHKDNTHKTISAPLKTMELFAGCGGTSIGLEESGATESGVAVEKDPYAGEASEACRTFKHNFPKATVKEMDVNKFIQLALDGDESTCELFEKCEMLVGGPPCQGFSRMNKYAKGENAMQKNACVISYLTAADYGRFRFGIMENVRQLTVHSQGRMCTYIIKQLLLSGYQVAVMMLQAGNYGVPQNRRRTIISFCDPWERLPSAPTPTHSFSASEGYTVGLCRFETVLGRHHHPESVSERKHCVAAFPFVTVFDGISDLGQASTIGGRIRMENMSPIQYNTQPITAYQKSQRHRMCSNAVTNHYAKELTETDQKRVSCVPKSTHIPDPDWRLMPNKDPLITYNYTCREFDLKFAERKGELRGVCECNEDGFEKASKKECRRWPMNTVIPMCLPHTSARHAQWAGLYGRVTWTRSFQTATTQHNPMNKTGRILHPEEDRLLTVREMARCQSFPDWFEFLGKNSACYKMIGNAVPPALAKAIGQTIIEARQ